MPTDRAGTESNVFRNVFRGDTKIIKGQDLGFFNWCEVSHYPQQQMEGYSVKYVVFRSGSNLLARRDASGRFKRIQITT